MAKVTRGTDNFANIYDISITESAADTLTFEEVNVGLNIFDKVGLIIHRMDIKIANTQLDLIAADDDEIAVGLVQSNQISTISFGERSVVDMWQLVAWQEGTPANFLIDHMPYTRDYTGLPGGGILVAPSPLYVALDSTGTGASIAAAVRLYFTIKQLKDADYFELLESRRFFG